MNLHPDEDNLLRRYLLDDVTAEERRQVEDQLLSDAGDIESGMGGPDKLDLVDRLLLAEDELLDDHARAALSPRERELFETNLFITPERQQNLLIAQELVNYAATNPELETAAPPAEAKRDEGRRNSQMRQAGRTDEQDRERREWWRGPFVPAWRIAVYTVLLLGLGLGIWRWWRSDGDIKEGMAALNRAYRAQRPLEARISDFAHAPYLVKLGNEGAGFNQRDRDDAEFFLRRTAGGGHNAEALHALGRLYLAKRDFGEALKLFKEALQITPQAASLHNDLGVALMEMSRDEQSSATPAGNLERLAESIKHFSRALELDNSSLPALFNRALCYQQMASWHSAAADWQEYLSRDANSKWADEARHYQERLKNEQQERKTQNKERLLQDYLQAYEAGDEEKAWAVLSQSKELISGKHIAWQLLRAALAVDSDGQQQESPGLLQALAYAGRLEQQRGKDGFVAQLAAYYLAANPATRSSLRQAQNFLAQGHRACVESNLTAALAHYSAAAKLFTQAGDQLEANLAYYLMSHCLASTPALQEGLRLAGEVAAYSEARDYKWLTAQALSAQAGIRVLLNEPAKVIELYVQALKLSEEIGDHYNIQRLATALAYFYKNIGNYQSSLLYLERSLRQAQIVWPGERQMWRTYDAATRVFTLMEQYSAAISYGQEALQLSLRDPPDPAFSYLSYIHLGAVYGKLRRDTEAMQYTRLGYTAAGNIPGQGRIGSLAYAALQSGHLCRQADNFETAVVHYDEAIKFNAELGYQADLYEAQKGKLLCYLRQGDDGRAAEQMQVVLDSAEKYRTKLKEDGDRNIFFDLEQDIYDIAIGFLHYKLNKREQAFECSELSKARSLLDQLKTRLEGVSPAGNFDAGPYKLTQIRQQMPAGLQLVQFAVLPDKVLIWVVSQTDFSVAETNIAIDELRRLVDEFIALTAEYTSLQDGDEMRRQARHLYSLLIEPVKSVLPKDGRICVVPDKFLYHLPFNALVASGSGRFLLEEYQLSFAPSSSIFLLCTQIAQNKSARVAEKVLAVGNPKVDRARFDRIRYPDLPEARREAKQIAAVYATRVTLTDADAVEEITQQEMSAVDVIHLAAHYLIEPADPLRSGLLLANPPAAVRRDAANDGLLRVQDVNGMERLRARLVVLSACQTGGDKYYRGEGMIGLARAFIGAGVPLVVASLWPVESVATTELMINFHRYRKKAGLLTGAALRQAQLDMLRHQNADFRHPYFWAAFTSIGGQAGF